MKNIAVTRRPLPMWIIVWLVVCYSIIAWDISFVLLRPASLPDGELGFLWATPYARYITVDLSYGDLHNHFTWAHAMMSIGEIALAIVAIILNFKQKAAFAILLTFSCSILTATKTLLIFLVEIVSGLESVGHNTTFDLLTLYVLPNVVWIFIPLLVVVKTARMIADHHH